MGRTLGMRIYKGECSYVYEYLRLYCMTYRKKNQLFFTSLFVKLCFITTNLYMGVVFTSSSNNNWVAVHLTLATYVLLNIYTSHYSI
jgi:hypothetical protein